LPENGSTETANSGALGLLQRLGDAPVPELAANSLLFGLLVAFGLEMVAWLIGPESVAPPSAGIWPRLVRPFVMIPPLVLGIGVLCLPWLAGLASRFLLDTGRWHALAHALDDLAGVLDPAQNSWILMALGVGLAILCQFAAAPLGSGVPGAPRSRHDSAAQAAVLAGASRGRARRLSLLRQRGRWFGGFVVFWVLAATNLTPALLFAPWTDGRIAAAGVVVLAAGAGDERAQAAALALCVIVVNVGAFAVARLTSAVQLSEDLA
jgi:hypothetical protein